MSAISSGRPNFERSSEFSPKKLYDFSVLKTRTGTYRVSLRFGKKKEGNYLYYFRNKMTGQMYVGETRRLNSRVSAHLHAANKYGQPSAKKTSQKLYAHLWENPEHFEFGVLKLGNDESPRQKEKKATNHYGEGELKNLYNLREGGGGQQGKTSDDKENGVVQNLHNQFNTLA
jgi:hypothetical protein